MPIGCTPQRTVPRPRECGHVAAHAAGLLREASRKRERSGLLDTERLDAVDPERVEHRNVEAIGRRVRRELAEPPGGGPSPRASPHYHPQILVIMSWNGAPG